LLHTGQHIVIAGLLLHLISFIIFLLIVATFHYRLVTDKPIRKQLPSSDYTKQASITTPCTPLNKLPFNRHMFNIYFVSLLILIRGLVKGVEYFQGNSGVLLKHEIFFYGLDAFLMMILMVAFNVFHPSGITAAIERKKSDVEVRDRSGS